MNLILMVLTIHPTDQVTGAMFGPLELHITGANTPANKVIKELTIITKKNGL